MKVYNLYMKILKKNLTVISIYIIVFIAILLIIVSVTNKEAKEEFEQSKTKIALFDYDNTKLTESLKQAIEKSAEIIEIEDEESKLKDALFFYQIRAIVKIEEGFTQDFINNKDVSVEVNTIPNSYDSVYIERNIENYLNTFKGYMNNMDEPIETVISKTNESLSYNTDVDMLGDKKDFEDTLSSTYLTYIPYIAFSTLIIGIGCTMLVINNKKLKRRMLIAPISNKRLNFELALGHFSYAGILLLIFLVVWYFVNPKFITQVVSIYYFINIIAFMLSAISIAFFLSVLLKSQSAQNAAANVVGLATSFIGGVFVPQELLSEVVINISRFTPTYWYTSNINYLSNATDISINNISNEYLISIGVQLGFAICFMLLTLAVNKNRRMSS